MDDRNGKRRRGRRLILAAAAAALLAAGVCLARAASAPMDMGRRYMELLSAGRYDEAHRMILPKTRSRIGIEEFVDFERTKMKLMGPIERIEPGAGGSRMFYAWQNFTIVYRGREVKNETTGKTEISPVRLAKKIAFEPNVFGTWHITLGAILGDEIAFIGEKMLRSGFSGPEERKEARAWIERAPQLDPESVAGHSKLGTLLLREARESGKDGAAKLDEAIAHLRRAAELCSRSVQTQVKPAEIWLNLGAAHRQRGGAGDLARAESACMKALSLDPDLAEGHYLLGNIRFCQAQALKANPGKERAALSYFGQAMEEMQKTLKLKPSLVQAHHELAVTAICTTLLMQQIGHPDWQSMRKQAIALTEQALKHEPDSDFLKENLKRLKSGEKS